MQSAELTCQELVELVTEYLDGALSAADRERFEAHLLSCRVCPRYVEQLRTTARLVGALSEQDLEPGVRATLLDAFRDWKRQ